MAANNDSLFEVIERHWQSAPPVNIIGIITELGIFYREERFRTDDSAYIAPLGGDGYRIVVNATHSLVRRRFSAAHELGHYAYHRDLIGDGIGDGAAYRSTNAARYSNTLITPAHESQANRFAATTLMPKDLIDRLVEQHGLQLPYDVGQVASMLQVSEQALRIRLGLSDVV